MSKITTTKSNIMEDLEKLMQKAIKDLEKLRSSLVCDED